MGEGQALGPAGWRWLEAWWHPLLRLQAATLDQGLWTPSCVQRHEPPGSSGLSHPRCLLRPQYCVLSQHCLLPPVTCISWSCVLNNLHAYLTKHLFPKEIKKKRKTTCNCTTYFQKYLFCIIICSPAKTRKCISKLLLSSSLTPGLFSHIF